MNLIYLAGLLAIRAISAHIAAATPLSHIDRYRSYPVEASASKYHFKVSVTIA